MISKEQFLELKRFTNLQDYFTGQRRGVTCEKSGNHDVWLLQ